MNVGSSNSQIVSPTHPETCIDDLPLDIVEEMIGRLYLADRIRAGSVCKKWRTITLKKQQIQHAKPQLPWMLIASASCNGDRVSLFSLLEGRSYDFVLPEPIRGGWCRGSSRGWLVIARENLDVKKKLQRQVFLFNPISGAHVELPPISAIPHFDEFIEKHRRDPFKFPSFIQKIVLSSDDASTCTVAAWFGGDVPLVLAICQANDKQWTILREADVDNSVILDFSFSEGILNVLTTFDGGVEDVPLGVRMDEVSADFMMELKKNGLAIRIISAGKFKEELDFDGIVPYLVNFNGDLLIAIKWTEKIPGSEYQRPKKFSVYKMKNHTASDVYPMLEPVKSLEDQVLFLGHFGNNFSVAGKHLKGLGQNCIYFLDDIDAYGDANCDATIRRDSGLFHLEDERIKRIFPATNFPLHNCWFLPPN
ncbi:hypothetical protein Tsubulata_000668 [Turnera subulata]|uniref:F-box domain-containing protein n=1 Tax=Turnera subulata TaxID=218843 RepID=A0A9Q0J843_9ROSI|nr:hypothetical protein Tsubulata_000668 [Turnera subulata]